MDRRLRIVVRHTAHFVRDKVFDLVNPRLKETLHIWLCDVRASAEGSRLGTIFCIVGSVLKKIQQERTIYLLRREALPPNSSPQDE